MLKSRFVVVQNNRCKFSDDNGWENNFIAVL